MKILFLILLAFSMQSCTRYQNTSTLILDDLGEEYELVKEIPGFEDADGLYSCAEDKIYIDKDVPNKNYIMLHELMHKYRRPHKLSDLMLEEMICIDSAFEIGGDLKLQMKMNKFDLPDVISNTLKAGNVKRRHLTSKDRLTISNETEKTKAIFIERLMEKGFSTKDIDWVRTAILLLL